MTISGVTAENLSKQMQLNFAHLESEKWRVALHSLLQQKHFLETQLNLLAKMEQPGFQTCAFLSIEYSMFQQYLWSWNEELNFWLEHRVPENKYYSRS